MKIYQFFLIKGWFFSFFCIPYYQEMPFFGPNLRENYPTRNNKTNSRLLVRLLVYWLIQNFYLKRTLSNLDIGEEGDFLIKI